MKKSVLKEIQNLIIKGQLERAISSLIEYCEKGDSGNYEESILLSTQFHIIERKERIGLGEFSQEINRIAQAVLRIVIDEEKKSLPIHEEKESSESIDSRLIAIETKVDRLFLRIFRIPTPVAEAKIVAPGFLLVSLTAMLGAPLEGMEKPKLLNNALVVSIGGEILAISLEAIFIILSCC